LLFAELGPTAPTVEQFTPVPEPATLALCAFGVVAAGWNRRRRNNRRS
jgi:hypothetical protein